LDGNKIDWNGKPFQKDNVIIWSFLEWEELKDLIEKTAYDKSGLIE